MSDAGIWLAAFALISGGSSRQALTYTAASIVNAASNEPGAIAPNALVTIYGSELSYETVALAPSHVVSGALPVAPPGAWISVQFGLTDGHVLYASPTQINVLVPAVLKPGKTTLRVLRQGLSGPAVELNIKAAAPGLFVWSAGVIATRTDGSLVTRDSPAVAGDVVILYATGLGQTVPRQDYGRMAYMAASIEALNDFDVLLDGVPVERDRILYAGVTPGFAGLYQVNLLLPVNTKADPEIRLRAGGVESPPGTRLAIRPQTQP